MSQSDSRSVGRSILIFVALLAGCPGRVESLIETTNEPPGASGPTNNGPAVKDPIVVADPARVVNMGTNITDVFDASTELHFTDVFMASRDWISQPADGMEPWDNEMPIATDANGWVTSLTDGQAVATLMIWDIDGHHPVGQYVVVYEGEGTLEFDSGVEVVSRRSAADGQPNVIVIKVPADGEGIYMRISATDPQGTGDYIRNIKVWMPGVVDPDNPTVEPASPFYSAFLDNVRPYRALRFMNWGKVIETTLERWADRTTTQSARQSGDSGVAVEYMIMLTNELQRDPWFCMPHVADDDFVRRFAEMVRDNLDFSDPKRKVYIEYSNEIWNPIFSMNQYCREQGVAAGLMLDDDDNDYNASLRYQAQRSAEIFVIWEEVFGGTDRLVRVMAGWSEVPFVNDLIMGWNGIAERTDAFAIGSYFAIETAQEVIDSGVVPTVDELLDLISVPGGALDVAIREIGDAKELTNRYGIELVAYEGGQHLIGPAFGSSDSEEIINLFMAANQSERMYGLYARYLNAWRDAGGELFMHFNSCQNYGMFGSWGAIRYQDETAETRPKYRAILDALRGALPVTGE